MKFRFSIKRLLLVVGSVSTILLAFQNCNKFAAVEGVASNGSEEFSSTTACNSASCLKNNLAGSLTDHLDSVPPSDSSTSSDSSKAFVSATVTGTSMANGVASAVANSYIQLHYTTRNAAFDVAYQIYDSNGEQVQTYFNLKRNVSEVYNISLAHISAGNYSLLVFARDAQERFVRTNPILFRVDPNTTQGAADDIENCFKAEKLVINANLNYNDPLAITVPFKSSCAGVVRGGRLNLTNNSAHVSVKMVPGNEIAFVGTPIEVSNPGFDDRLITTNFAAYGDIVLSLNYSFSYKSKAKSVTININVHIEKPGEETSPGKLSCVMPNMEASTYTEAYQYRGSDDRWSACTLYKCAADHYFDNSGKCSRLVVATTCSLKNYTLNWGSSATQSENCNTPIVGERDIALNQSVLIDNVRSGFVGKQKVECIPWKSQRQVKQVIDGPMINIEVSEATPHIIASIGQDPMTETTCRKISFRGCSGEEAHSSEGHTYYFRPTAMAHGQNQIVTGVPEEANNTLVAKRGYSCTDGRWLSKPVASDFVNHTTVTLTKEANGSFFYSVGAGSQHFNYCFIEVVSLPNYIVLHSRGFTPVSGTVNGNYGNTSVGGSQKATLYCTGQDVMTTVVAE